MFSENIEVVTRLLEAFNRGDFGALNELDPRAELQDEPRIPGAGWNYGYQGAVDWAAKLRQSFGELSFAIDDPTEAGESVVTHWRAEGEGKRSGAKVAMAGYCVFTLHRGKVCRVAFFENERSALEAARVDAGTAGAERGR
jgi:ketosteroid isomerase-like protein